MPVQINLPFVKPIVYTFMYRPPHSKVELFENIEALFSQLDEDHKEFFVSGDFNLFDKTDNDTKHPKRIHSTYHCKQIVKEPTRVIQDTRALIDHIVSNKTKHVSSCGIIPCGISDHDIVHAVRCLRLPEPNKISKTVTVRKYNNFDITCFLNDLNKPLLMKFSCIPKTQIRCGKLGRAFSCQLSKSMPH